VRRFNKNAGVQKIGNTQPAVLTGELYSTGIDQKVRADCFGFIAGRKGFRNFKKAYAMIKYDD
jgi:hypothetical protein